MDCPALSVAADMSNVRIAEVEKDMVESKKPLRVLFVVTSRYWITAVEAHQIMKHNPQIRGVLCSVPILDELLERASYLEKKIDLVHFMVPVAGRRYLDRFEGNFPCVATIYHIEPGYSPEAISVNARADSVMIISEMWRSELIARGVPADRIFLMPNGVDTGVFCPPDKAERTSLRRSMGFAPDETVIGYSGQPGRDNGWRKGIDVFINALKVLVREGRRIAVVVGGPGWKAALSEIRALGIKTYHRSYVLDADEGAPMYRALDFFWVTSRIEGGPSPLVEAMSSGVCCISTKVGIAPEIIRDGINACLVDIEDATRIAVLTGKLMDGKDERERMGREARQTIVSTYDWSQTAKRASHLYEFTMHNFEQRFAPIDRQKVQLESGHNRDSDAESRKDNDDQLLLPEDAHWLEAQEQLLWARELCRMGERRVAFQFGWRASLIHPFSVRTWSFLSNLVLSDQARGLVRILRTSLRS